MDSAVSSRAAPEQIPASAFPALVPLLADLLVDCVNAGAAIHFVPPIDHGRAARFWQGVLPDLVSGARKLWVIRDGARIVGTVQIVLGQPDNGQHRAEVSKMMVHPAARRQGLGAKLLAAVEAEAVGNGRTLLLLDTRAGDAGERMYLRAGFLRFGNVPAYAVNGDGELEPCTYMYKLIGPGVSVRLGRADAPEATALMSELSADLLASHGSPGSLPDVADEDMVFALADIDGVPVGCGALVLLGDGVGEIRRMYARPGTKGVGTSVLGYLEREARARGLRALMLETRLANRRAVAFYVRHGYLPREAYGRYVGRPECVCFEKTL
jgi:GNAT superfamily N-acetyltransferase